MQIHYQFVAAAAIALIASVGSASAGEITVADTAGAPFALLDGIATEQMSIQELAATRGAAGVLYKLKLENGGVGVSEKESILFGAVISVTGVGSD